jgi:hypothetical protein
MPRATKLEFPGFLTTIFGICSRLALLKVVWICQRRRAGLATRTAGHCLERFISSGRGSPPDDGQQSFDLNEPKMLFNYQHEMPPMRRKKESEADRKTVSCQMPLLRRDRRGCALSAIARTG